jgi:hypothetical protein
MKKYLLSLFCILGLSSCTFSVTMAHTEGTASDVVDETQNTNPKIDPTINVPVQSTGSGQTVPIFFEPVVAK